jgi:hypothetical protein
VHGAQALDGNVMPLLLAEATGAVAAALAVLLVFADPAWAHGVGAVSLIACAVTAFALAAGPPGLS